MDPLLTLALALIVLGFVLFVAELFLPTGGIEAVTGLACLIVGVVLAFVADTAAGLWTLLGVCVGVPAFLTAAVSLWPKTPMGRRLFLTPPAEDATVAPPTLAPGLSELRGRIGRAVSPLRPAGAVDFDGRRVDTITEGMMVEAGRWVRVVEVRGTTVVVRPVERPVHNDFEMPS